MIRQRIQSAGRFEMVGAEVCATHRLGDTGVAQEALQGRDVPALDHQVKIAGASRCAICASSS